MQVLRAEPDLVAFCLDYFPTVQADFSAAMGFKEKLNILFMQVDTDEILARLRDMNDVAVSSCEHLLEFVSNPEPPKPTPPVAVKKPTSEQRTYQIWSHPAEQFVTAALTALGYTYHKAFEQELVIVTQPLNGKALYIVLANLMGSTSLVVKTIPSDCDDIVMIHRFFQTFETLCQHS